MRYDEKSAERSPAACGHAIDGARVRALRHCKPRLGEQRGRPAHRLPVRPRRRQPLRHPQPHPLGKAQAREVARGQRRLDRAVLEVELYTSTCRTADGGGGGGARPPGLRLAERVRLAVALRLEAARPHREAVRRAAALLGASQEMQVSARGRWPAPWMRSGTPPATARRISPGTPSGSSWRAIYGETLLFWLRDDSEDDAPTLAFLDRRLADHARFHKAQRRASERLARWLPGEAAA